MSASDKAANAALRRIPSVSMQVAQAFEGAVGAYQTSDWAGAERLCRAVLGEVPDFFDALYMLGLVMAQSGRAEDAADWLRRAATVNPNDAALHSNLGNTLRELRRFEEAIESYDHALALQPDFLAANLNRGVALQDLGRIGEALQSYDRALELNPQHAPTHNNRGNAMAKLGWHEEALACYANAIALKPDFADAHYNLGNVQKELGQLDAALDSYQRAIQLGLEFEDIFLNRGVTQQDLGRLQDALASFDKIIEINPAYVAAYINRGNTLQKLKRFDEALASHERAIQLQPANAEAHYNRGNALKDLSRLDEALASYDQAIALTPDEPKFHVNRGATLQQLGRLDDSMLCFDTAIALRADYAAAYSNRGVALHQLRRKDQAFANYAKAIALNPNHVHAHFNLALLCLAVGDLSRGWAEFEWRWKTDDYLDRAPVVPAPMWNGERLDGRLLVRNEQGVGDEIFYAGMFAKLCDYAKALTVCVDVRLLPLFRRSFEGIEFVSPSMLTQELTFDAQTSMGSLGRHLRKNIDAIDAPAAGYLRADSARARDLRARLAGEKKKICGLSWVSKSPASGANKSMRLSDLEPLLRLPGFDFVDLQYGDNNAEIELLEATRAVRINRIPEIDNFNDIDGLAALIEACDVVVTVSNTTAHLAAAMGKRVFIMLPYSPGLLWYWHFDREDSPWYPSARLFRQKSAGDWQGVVARVAKTLRESVDA
ncbi:MAG: tetratricopeptide repeat protein [Burkholderiales bacterium]